MLSRIKLYLKNFDWIMFSAVLLLVVFGLVEIYSVALGRGSVNLLNFHKQLISALLGFLVMFIVSFIDFHSLKSLSRYIYFIFLILLGAVLFLGETVNGTKGWFFVGGFAVQPVELAKLALILFLSSYFADLATKVKTFRHLLISGIIAALPMFLIVMQPDFGSSLILGAIWLILVIAAGFDRRYLAGIFLSIFVLALFAWIFFFNSIQKDRILNFIDPSANALGSGYNTVQSTIAIGSGGLFGKGVGFGSQSQLKFLPEAQTDFIFAVIAEELGFFGALMIIIFYSVFFFRCFRALPKINSDFGIYFIIGAAGLVFIQMFVNIGMVSALVPVVGLPLPFVSYGGSSLLSLLIIVGIIENIIIRSRISY